MFAASVPKFVLKKYRKMSVPLHKLPDGEFKELKCLDHIPNFQFSFWSAWQMSA